LARYVNQDCHYRRLYSTNFAVRYSILRVEGTTIESILRALDPRGLSTPSLKRAICQHIQQIQDDTSYLHHDDGRLCPGVRVSSGPLTNFGNQATILMSSTSGVILRHKSLERLTLANHGFPTTEVYHPDTNGVIIADITHRLSALDIALAKLYNPFRYTNTRYFDAPVPIRLLQRTLTMLCTHLGPRPPPLHIIPAHTTTNHHQVLVPAHTTTHHHHHHHPPLLLPPVFIPLLR
jgi:hypothetical protein